LTRFNILSNFLSFASLFLRADRFLARRLLLPDELEEEEEDEDDSDEEDGGDEAEDDDDVEAEDVEDEEEEEEDVDVEDDDDDDEEDEEDVESDLPLRRGSSTSLADAIVTFFFIGSSPLSLDRLLPLSLSVVLLKCTPEGTFLSLCRDEMLSIASAARLLPPWVPARLIDDMNSS
jgi:hypothetical protein